MHTKLHELLNDLQVSYLDVAHFLSEQLTSIKKVDFPIDFNRRKLFYFVQDNSLTDAFDRR